MAYWETGEGRVMHGGTAVLTSDQIVLHAASGTGRRGLRAFVPCGCLPAGLRRRVTVEIMLEDGRRGRFVVADRRPGLLCLNSRGPLR